MSELNPILNNPYEEPGWHYATNLQGELDYSRPTKGRRIFTPEVQTIPVQQGQQTSLLNLNDIAAAEHSGHLVNLLRREVGAWRHAKYPQTTRISRELLHFWFLNLERDIIRQVFFCGGDKDEFDDWKKGLSALAKAATKRKAEQTLKIEIDDEAFARVYGHTSHPFPAKKSQKIAVRVISQFGEEITKVVGL